MEGAEALAGVKILQHEQEELVEQSVLLGGDEERLGLVILGRNAVCLRLNLLLDETEFIVAWCSLEELGDRVPDIAFVHPGGMGMTRRRILPPNFFTSFDLRDWGHWAARAS